MTNVLMIDDPQAIERALARSERPAGRGASNDFDYAYDAPNGRFFEARGFFDGTYFLSEMKPTGMRCRFENGSLVSSFKDPRILELAEDPNRFRECVRAEGIPREEIAYAGGGLGVASVYYDDLASVAAAIAAALAANAWYADVDRARLEDPEFKAELARRSEEGRREHRRHKRALHAQAQQDSGLFKGLHGWAGPLSDDAKTRILTYLNQPTEPNFDDVSGLMVKGHVTVWQAWAEIDPAAPRIKPSAGWPRLPDPETLRAALRRLAEQEPE